MPAGAIPFPFGDCRICSDKATGVHYGVATCEGCKVGAEVLVVCQASVTALYSEGSFIRRFASPEQKVT